VAQVWRDPNGRQADLARRLRAVDVQPLREQTGRAAGELLARTGTADVVDATVVLVAERGDRIVTSDPEDLETLAAGLGLIIVAC
jgi:hypothetical protein